MNARTRGRRRTKHAAVATTAVVMATAPSEVFLMLGDGVCFAVDILILMGANGGDDCFALLWTWTCSLRGAQAL